MTKTSTINMKVKTNVGDYESIFKVKAFMLLDAINVFFFSQCRPGYFFSNCVYRTIIQKAKHNLKR